MSRSKKDRLGGWGSLTEDLIKRLTSCYGMAIRDNIGLTQDLIKRLTSYYGLALRSNTDVEDMKKAVMATFHNVSSTDAEPHHELCPSGARSWCRHRAAEAEGKPQPPHTYNLPNKVVEALRPVYQRLSDPQLQARCSGNKTQNAAESLHSVIWSLISKQQHASHFTVEVAVHEAVARYNAGNFQAYTKICAAMGVQPGALTLHRAAKKTLSEQGSHRTCMK